MKASEKISKIWVIAMLEKNKVSYFEDQIKNFNMLNYHVLEGMADWVRVIDRNGTIIYANKTMKGALGTEIVGKKCYEALGKIRPCSFCITERSIATGEIIQKEENVGDRIFSVKSSPVSDSDGNIYAAVEVFRDVTRERKLEKELREKTKKLNKDITFAKVLQEKILPRKGSYNNIKINYLYKPCEMLSGDMFDVFYIDKDNIGIYISDVAGHGITASMMTMFIRQTMRAIKDDILSPSKTLTELHKRFIDLNLDDEKYLTIFYGIFNCSTDTFKYANGGHNCIPILFDDNNVELLKMKGYPISYLFDEIHYNENMVQLKNGDRILFYTDGILEVRNKNKEEFGEKRIIKAVKEAPESPIKNIENKANSYMYGDQKDDFALVLMKVEK